VGDIASMESALILKVILWWRNAMQAGLIRWKFYWGWPKQNYEAFIYKDMF
jgi:hypothetical protein